MKKQAGFEKFFKQQKSGAKKEQFRQEKRKFKKELTERAEQKRLSVQQKETGARPTIQRKASTEQMPLNKYIAHGGLCSRRDAVDLIKGGKVKVNGELILEPGHKVAPQDEVKVAGKKIQPVNNLVYILVNKPKDYITTTDDPQQRKTVLDLIQKATTERVYPVGRLDRNTSGVLLLTNDGELSQKLTHPSNEIKKVYAVTLDKPLAKADFESILQGITLDDGPAKVDMLAYTDAADKTQIGVEIHSGRNRIVRRIFEHLGYDVKNLDRVMFAGLTKKNVTRGKWRYLNEKEVRELKFFGKGKGTSAPAVKLPNLDQPEPEEKNHQTPVPKKRAFTPVKKQGKAPVRRTENSAGKRDVKGPERSFKPQKTDRKQGPPKKTFGTSRPATGGSRGPVKKSAAKGGRRER